MKKILLLTDFTENANHAAVCAKRLCAQMKCDLLLYHSVQYMPIVPDFANGNTITETNDTLRNECRQHLLNTVKKLGQGFVATEGYHPKIAYESGEGNLGDNISLLTARQDIELVVMGGRSGGALDHLLTGSETAAVIKDSKKPVLIIPKSTHLSSVRKIAMATDFHATDFNALNFVYELAQQYDARLDVVHIIKPGSVVADIEPELLFRRHMTNVDPMRITYKQLLGDSTHDLVSHYCKENEVDLLAVTHQRHGWLSRLLGHSESIALLEWQQLPVLVFPPANQTE